LNRRGYSLLELLIALALLGALMSLAWSMLGSYRQAEQRGWDQSYRMQLVRAARELLENDADHWAATVGPTEWIEQSAVSPQSTGFRGSESEITVETMPSLDPLPWLEQITAVESSSERGPGGSAPASSATVDPGAGRQVERVHGPLSRARLRYSLTPIAETESGSPVCHLRRELAMIASRQQGTQDDPSPQDELNVADLYRLTEETADEGLSANAASTTTVRNLIDARFRFSDGRRWLSSWDESARGGLPRAIELSFDLPRPGETFASAREDRVSEDGERDTAIGFEVAAATAASAAAGEEALQRDVRIVIRVAAGDAATAVTATPEAAP
jgi:prepilin-type N-terminal cleavage/methylation domain-containing protein